MTLTKSEKALLAAQERVRELEKERDREIELLDSVAEQRDSLQVLVNSEHERANAATLRCEQLEKERDEARSAAARNFADLVNEMDKDDAERYRFLKERMTFYDTASSAGPVLASTAKRIWYHATNQTEYPLDAAIDAAREALSEQQMKGAE